MLLKTKLKQPATRNQKLLSWCIWLTVDGLDQTHQRATGNSNQLTSICWNLSPQHIHVELRPAFIASDGQQHLATNSAESGRGCVKLPCLKVGISESLKHQVLSPWTYPQHFGSMWAQSALDTMGVSISQTPFSKIDESSAFLPFRKANRSSNFIVDEEGAGAWGNWLPTIATTG